MKDIRDTAIIVGWYFFAIYGFLSFVYTVVNFFRDILM